MLTLHPLSGGLLHMHGTSMTVSSLSSNGTWRSSWLVRDVPSNAAVVYLNCVAREIDCDKVLSG